MKLELVPQLQIQQNLSLRLQQSAHILQLSVQELQTLLQDSLQNNPLLEPEPEPDPAPPVREGLTRSTHHDDGGLPSQDYLGSAPRSRDELILENVRLSRADERCRALCALIVNALDDNGYLREDFADLLPPDYEKVPLAEWESALALVQSLSIPGTGARNLQEALRLQVQARSRLSGPVRQALLDLIATELPALAQGDWTGVQTRLSLPSPCSRKPCANCSNWTPTPAWPTSSRRARPSCPTFTSTATAANGKWPRTRAACRACASTMNTPICWKPRPAAQKTARCTIR